MHSQLQHQLCLDSDPRGLSPEKLRGFRVTAPKARDSMLSMNGILWKDSGCAAQSDELADFEIATTSGTIPYRESEPESSPHDTGVGRNSVINFGEEDASATTAHEEPLGLNDNTIQEPSVFFHPLLYPSHLLDSMPDNMPDLVDFDGMNVFDA